MPQIPMLRITTHDIGDALELKLEGCLSGPSVSAAAACWDQVRKSSRRPMRVDLCGICHVDEGGRQLMTTMHLAGAQFVTAGCLMPEVVREISGAAAAPANVRRSRSC